MKTKTWIIEKEARDMVEASPPILKLKSMWSKDRGMGTEEWLSKFIRDESPMDGYSRRKILEDSITHYVVLFSNERPDGRKGELYSKEMLGTWLQAQPLT